jgi:hypothetical protein
MKTRLLWLVITSLSFSLAGDVVGEETAPASSTSEAPATVAPTDAQPPAEAVAALGAEPTETEMKAAVQRNLDNLNAMMRQPVNAPSSNTARNPYAYSPYWRYYHPYYYRPASRESDYANWTDVARSAGATTRVEITSFKKVRCAPAPDQGGFTGEYIAELLVKGNNPAAQAVMETSGKKMSGVFVKGDKGWIFGESK